MSRKHASPAALREPGGRSLRGRLLVLLALVIAAALAAGVLMVGLFRQSATAQVARAEADVGRACDAVASAYRFYTAGWNRAAPALDDAGFRRELVAVVHTALRDRPGIEGGIWQGEAGPLAYAFPTYQGSGLKTDLPAAELPRIASINRAALADERATTSRYDAASQTLLLTACPLPGPIAAASGWTMTRVDTFAGRSYQQLMAGLAVLLASVVAAGLLLTRLTVTWSRQVARIESALAAHDITTLPRLPTTGERELDRIVTALNDAGARLADARRQADEMTRRVAAGERLAAIGRVAAGVAHEIRNPIAAMRLKAESAVCGNLERKNLALSAILEQIARLDALLRRLLSVTEPDRPRRERVDVARLLDEIAGTYAELVGAKQLAIERRGDDDLVATLDGDQVRRAVDNLVVNAIEAAPAGSRIVVEARRRAGDLVLSVHDQGPGPPAAIRAQLFEPFVSGRADGTGLGLSIVREVAEAHGGSARFDITAAGTVFEIAIPWQPS